MTGNSHKPPNHGRSCKVKNHIKCSLAHIPCYINISEYQWSQNSTMLIGEISLKWLSLLGNPRHQLTEQTISESAIYLRNISDTQKQMFIQSLYMFAYIVYPPQCQKYWYKTIPSTNWIRIPLFWLWIPRYDIYIAVCKKHCELSLVIWKTSLCKIQWLEIQVNGQSSTRTCPGVKLAQSSPGPSVVLYDLGSPPGEVLRALQIAQEWLEISVFAS